MRALFWFLCTAIVATAATPSTSAPSAAGGGSPQRFARVEGRQILAPDGAPLRLRGINLGNWLLPEGYMFKLKSTNSPQQIETLFAELIGDMAAAKFWHDWRERYITREDIRFIREAGFNSVRIPINWRLFVTPDYPQRLEGVGWELLDRAIAWCEAEHLWVVIDLHGAPGGQTGDNIDDSRGRPLLFDDADAQALTTRLWVALAQRYRDRKWVLGYDLLNEPIAHYFDTARLNPKLAPFYRQVTAAVREVDPAHIIFLGGAQWDSKIETAGEPFAPNLAYTFHTYWTEPKQETLAPFVAFREKHNVPLWLGESGENKDEWIATFRQLLETNDIGWCFWPYKKMDAASCPVAFTMPAGWDKVVAYAGSPRADFKSIRASLPPFEEMKTVFETLLANIELARCRPNRGYIEALGLTVPAQPVTAP